MEVEQGATRLHLGVKEVGDFRGQSEVGVEVPFLFRDGTVVKFANTQAHEKKGLMVSDVAFTVSAYSLTVDAAQLELLAGQDVKMVRLPLVSGTHDWEPNKGLQGKIREAAACVVSQLK